MNLGGGIHIERSSPAPEVYSVSKGISTTAVHSYNFEDLKSFIWNTKSYKTSLILSYDQEQTLIASTDSTHIQCNIAQPSHVYFPLVFVSYVHLGISSPFVQSIYQCLSLLGTPVSYNTPLLILLWLIAPK